MAFNLDGDFRTAPLYTQKDPISEAEQLPQGIDVDTKELVTYQLLSIEEKHYITQSTNKFTPEESPYFFIRNLNKDKTNESFCGLSIWFQGSIDFDKLPSDTISSIKSVIARVVQEDFLQPHINYKDIYNFLPNDLKAGEFSITLRFVFNDSAKRESSFKFFKEQIINDLEFVKQRMFIVEEGHHRHEVVQGVGGFFYLKVQIQ